MLKLDIFYKILVFCIISLISSIGYAETINCQPDGSNEATEFIIPAEERTQINVVFNGIEVKGYTRGLIKQDIDNTPDEIQKHMLPSDLSKLESITNIHVDILCDGEDLEGGTDMKPDEHYSCPEGKGATIRYFLPKCSATNSDPIKHPDRKAIVTITKTKRNAHAASSAPAAKVANETAHHVETEGFHEMFGGSESKIAHGAGVSHHKCIVQ